MSDLDEDLTKMPYKVSADENDNILQ